MKRLSKMLAFVLVIALAVSMMPVGSKTVYAAEVIDEVEGSEEIPEVEEAEPQPDTGAKPEPSPEPVPEHQHEIVEDAAVEATCTETGLTAGSHCSSCEEVIVAQEEVEALGHDFSKWKTVKKATYTEKGTKERTCSRCELKETQDIPVLTLKATTLTVKATYTNYITLSWKKVANADCYQVYRSTSKSGKYSQIATVEKLTYKNSNLKPGKTYYYKVYACGPEAAYKSSESNIVTGKTALPAPTMKKTVNVTNNSIEISWEKVSGANGYYIYRKSTSGSFSRIATVTSGSTLTYTDKKASAAYSYKVRAYRTISGTKYSGYDSEIIQTRVLKKPTVTIVPSETELKDKVTWKAVTGATHYELYYRIDEEGKWKKAAQTTKRSYTMEIDHGKVYYYKVRALYKKDGVTSYGAYSANKNSIHYYYPQYTARTRVSYEYEVSVKYIQVSIKNKGTETMKIYSDDATLYNSSNDVSDLQLYNYKEYKKTGKYKKVSSVNVKPGESTTLLFGVKDGKAMFSEASVVAFAFSYDGVLWVNACNISTEYYDYVGVL